MATEGREKEKTTQTNKLDKRERGRRGIKIEGERERQAEKERGIKEERKGREMKEEGAKGREGKGEGENVKRERKINRKRER